MTSPTSADYIFHFGNNAPDQQADPARMGIKGANLVTMAQIKLPVPPGFIVSVELGKIIASGDEALAPDQRSAIRQAIVGIENEMGRKFGGQDSPLLISVRSGASVSMPGMMDTVLNLGLNNETVEILARETADERFAWDTYRRFIQSFAMVVLGLELDEFEEVLQEVRDHNNVNADADLSAEVLKQVTSVFLDIVEREIASPFPQDAYEQLDFALLAVFNSWNTKRAIRYRDMHSISHGGGTAAVIQTMVFGNRDGQSCTGVYFTRNPSTGEKNPYGEYMLNAQGEDVVSGIRTPMELTEADRARAMSENPSMEKVLPDAFAKLLKAGDTLETHFSDMQEIEFTVESERLFLLQTRNGKRTPRASLRIAVEMAQQGKISKVEAIARCDMTSLKAMLVSKIAAKKDTVLFTKGLPASPGAATGKIVFTSGEAVALSKMGQDCILVRPETDPKDVHGMDASAGILTTRGGMTSHAAVVARGMGKPCITAAMTLKIDLDSQTCSCAGKVLKAGDVISIDGGAGAAFIGEQPIIIPAPDGELAVLLNWKEEHSN
ncbi:MAG: PEP/pyruvate-binding domain-containing protein [Rhizobiaceae bacterium]